MKQVNSDTAGIYDYTFSLQDKHAHLSKISNEQNFIEIEYDSNNKVIGLYQPKGKNGDKKKTYSFEYDKHSTKVWDAFKHLTIYQFSPQRHLTKIEFRDENNQNLKQEEFSWSGKENEKGYLIKKTTRLNDQIYQYKSYQYDHQGNVKIETIAGNITGEKSPSNFDHYTIKYQYSNDNRNLVTQKITPQETTIDYEYLKGTNLLTKELHSYEGKIQQRYFYAYDDNGELQEAIEDDGSSNEINQFTDVTYRKIKTISPITTPGASFGKPSEIVESYWDPAKGKQFTLRKTIYEYNHNFINSKGEKVILKTITDPLGRKSIEEFDVFQNLVIKDIIEKDEVVSKIIYGYNPKNQLVKQQAFVKANGSPLRDYLVSYTYNKRGLIVSEEEKGKILRYDYDACKRLITKQNDLRGNLLRQQTPAGDQFFTYDKLCRAVHISSPNWKAHLKAFDPAGNLLEMNIDLEQDRLKENYTYDRFNHLTSESNFNHLFRYDSLGNCLEKNQVAREFNDLNQLVFDGNQHHLFDPNGNLTHDGSINYMYDALDRLISIEKKEGSKTKFVYDAFNRCIQINEPGSVKNLFYINNQDIGSIVDGKVAELRLVQPEENIDRTFAIELQNKVYFPIQDYRSNVCGLLDSEGKLVQKSHYSGFGEKK